MNRDKKERFDDCVDQHFLTMTAINTAMMMTVVLMMPTILKNAWSSCKNRIDCNRRKLFPEPMHSPLPKEMLTSRWSLQSKMQPNVSRKRSQRWFLRFLAWWNIRPRTVLGHFLWARLTGENCSPCYYGQSVRREVRSAVAIIAALRPPIGFWGQEKANLCLYFKELAWRRGAESILARELQKWFT